MRISKYFPLLSSEYPRHLKCIRKGAFYILLEEEAFFFSERFSFRLTPLDKNAIKCGFPKTSLSKWKRVFHEAGWAFILVEDEDNIAIHEGEYPLFRSPIDAEAYGLVRERILKLGTIGLETHEPKGFLLKDRIEALYRITNGFLMKIPRKERYFLREKVERTMIAILDMTYRYMYIPHEREAMANSIFSEVLVLREFIRLTRYLGYLGKDTVYLDVSERCVEILKIVKALRAGKTHQ